MPSLAFLQTYAQEEDIIKTMDKLAEAVNKTSNSQTSVKEQNIADLGPWLVAIGPLMAASYGGTTKLQEIRNRKIELSAEFEKEIPLGLKNIIETQRRWIYRELKENYESAMEYHTSGKIPMKIAETAFRNAKEMFFKQYLNRSRLTKLAKDRFMNSADTLIEQYVTENQKDVSERIRFLMDYNVPKCIQSALLGYNKSKIVEVETEKILHDAWGNLITIFDHEQVILHKDVGMVYLRSELNKHLKEKV